MFDDNEDRKLKEEAEEYWTSLAPVIIIALLIQAVIISIIGIISHTWVLLLVNVYAVAVYQFCKNYLRHSYYQEVKKYGSNKTK